MASILALRVLFAAATKELAFSAADARRRVEPYSRLEVVATSVDDLLAAIDLQRLCGLSIWDALIVRAATIGGCPILYTEDL